MAEIEIKHVSKIFDVEGEPFKALDDINLEIEHGDIYGIIGMSGAGKSTLVRCLNFLEVPTEGEVLVGGRDMASLSDFELRKQRQDMAMIFQHFNLLMQKSVIENVCFPLYIQGAKKKEARERAMELLDVVGLKEKALAYPSQLSGGQKQRVAIARALACGPKDGFHSCPAQGYQHKAGHHDRDHHPPDGCHPGDLQECGYPQPWTAGRAREG